MNATVASFPSNGGYWVASAGYLKSVAMPFYARLMDIGFTNAYPWTPDTGDDRDFAPVNIGQVKNAFGFDVAPWLSADSDEDGLNNRQELANGTNLRLSDTDGDGFGDKWELDHGLNPLIDDASDDPDQDGLSNYAEAALGTNPLNPDTDSDGLPDGWEQQQGLNLFSDPGTNLGLKVWWKMDEAAGQVLSNAVSAAYPAWVYGYSARVSGRVGSALSFDGQSVYAAATQSLAAVTGAPFSVMAWVWYEGSNSMDYPAVLSDSSWAGGDFWPGYQLRFQKAWDKMVFRAGAATSTTYGAQIVGWAARTGEWVHLCGTHDGSKTRLYLNGRLAQERTERFEPRRQPFLLLGRDHANAESSYWKGRLDEVRIYSQALSSNQLAQVCEALDDPDADALRNEEEWQALTDAHQADSDADGLSDGQEVHLTRTDPLNPDSDADGLPDLWEVNSGTEALSDDALQDPDNDGLDNRGEYQAGADPLNPDSDADGLLDGPELQHNASPLNPDSDADGLSDYQEVQAHLTDPTRSDTDADGLSDLQEVQAGTNPLQADALEDPDHDGLDNAAEVAWRTQPFQSDTDSDGLLDGQETALGSDPLNPDTDSDGLPDGWEQQNGLNPKSGIAHDQRLLAWWKFDEGQGTKINNSISSNYSGYAMNITSANWITGVVGQALSFESSNSYVVVPQVPPIITQGNFTVSAWIYFDPLTPASFHTLLSDCRWSGDLRWPGYVLRYEPGYDSFSFRAGSEQTSSYGANQKQWTERYAKQWVHLAAVYDSGVVKLYVNGILAQENPSEFRPESNPELLIGCGHVNGSESLWHGALDDIRIYESALSVQDITDLFDAIGDIDGDGINNLSEYENSSNPAEPYASNSEGAIDLQFIPANWTTNDSVQYLAFFNDPNFGAEIHLRMLGDDMEFAVYDSFGQRHAILAESLLSNGLLREDMTNRVVAAWRNFNTKATNAELALFINGLDWQRTCNIVATPRLTSYDWMNNRGYQNAAFTRIDFAPPLNNAKWNWWSYGNGAYPARVSCASGSLQTSAYGIPNSLPYTSFQSKPLQPQQQILRPRTMVQAITQTCAHDQLQSKNDADIMIRQYAQIADAAEISYTWISGGLGYWHLKESNIQTIIDAGQEQGFDLAISSSGQFEEKICYKMGVTESQQAQTLHVDPTNGLVTLDSVYESGIPMCDMANRTARSFYLNAWSQELRRYTNYNHFFFNESALLNYTRNYYQSPTYSTSALSWFQEYVQTYYPDPKYSNIKFPLSLIDVRNVTNVDRFTNGLLHLDSSLTNIVSFCTDPDIWAKWWEWRQVVFNELIHDQCDILFTLNTNNPSWKGSIFLVSPLAAWTYLSGVNLASIDSISNINYIVMENHRVCSYGTQPADLEREVQLQLSATKASLLRQTSFGSYAMLHTYPWPKVTDGITNFTYNISWMTQDLAYAISPELNSQFVVVYSDALLVNIPRTSSYQNACYVPQAAQAWNAARFHNAWRPVMGLSPNEGEVFTATDVPLTWNSTERAVAYNLDLSTDSSFQSNVTSYAILTTNFLYSRTGPLPLNTPVYWRVRGSYQTFDINTNNIIVSTNVFVGKWSVAQQGFMLREAQ